MHTTAHSPFKVGNGKIIQLVEIAGELVGEIKMARTQGSTSLQFCKKWRWISNDNKRSCFCYTSSAKDSSASGMFAPHAIIGRWSFSDSKRKVPSLE